MQIETQKTKGSLFWGHLIVLTTALFLAGFKFSYLFTSNVFQSWDLHSHVTLVGRLREQIVFGNLSFFDRWWFTGWPALSFYAPGTHLLAALLSQGLMALGFQESDQLAVNILLAISLSLFPLTLLRVCLRISSSESSSELTTDEVDARRESPGGGLYLGLFCCLYSLWFLGHPAKHYGVGVDAAIPLGLFPQVLSWHLLLLIFGELFSPSPRIQESVNRKDIVSCRFSFYLALLALCHSISFLFILGVIALRYLWSPERVKLIFATFIGVLLSSFWFVPATHWGAAFCPSDKIPSAGGLFSLLFPDSFAVLFRSALSLDFLSVSWLPMFSVLSIFLSLPKSENGVSTNLQKAWVILTVLCFCLSSDYFGLTMPLSLHLYRFLIPGLLLSLPLMSLRLSHWVGGARLKVVLLPFILLMCGQEISHFPAIPENKPRKEEFAQESEVLRLLRSSEENRSERVFFEHQGRPDRADMRSPHYLPARLERESDRETVNGLFVQSSLSQAFPSFASKRLKIHTYNSKLPIGLTQESKPEVLVERLKDFGIRDLVLEANAPPPSWATAVAEVGPYRVVRIPGELPQPLQASSKILLGYLDLDGNRPFREMESYFYGSDELWQKFSLIDLNGVDNFPRAISFYLVSGDGATGKLSIPGKAFHIPKKSLRVPVDFITWDKEKEGEILSESELQKEISRLRELLSLSAPTFSPSQKSDSHSENDVPSGNRNTSIRPTLHWSENDQEITLEGLKVGEMYRLNYTYLPYWTAQGANLFRGDAERMWIEAKAPEAKLRYTGSGMLWDRVGKALSALGCVLLLLLHHSNRLPKQDYIS